MNRDTHIIQLHTVWKKEYETNAIDQILKLYWLWKIFINLIYDY